jgi:hypothetical protein
MEHKRSNLTDYVLISIKSQLWRLKETGEIQAFTVFESNEVLVDDQSYQYHTYNT